MQYSISAGHGPMLECILSIMFKSFIDHIHTQYDIRHVSLSSTKIHLFPMENVYAFEQYFFYFGLKNYQQSSRAGHFAGHFPSTILKQKL